MNNLRQIDGAKQQWLLENFSRSNDIPTKVELAAFLDRETNSPFPVCPLGGEYIIGRQNEDPKCSVGASAWPNNHELEPTYSWWGDVTAAYKALFGLLPKLGSQPR